jgi:two-component system, OmpR family, sensor kinase
MNVRTKFTLWIVLTAMLAASIFSGFVLSEVKEEAFELVDYELQAMANSIFLVLDEATEESRKKDIGNINYPLDRYWLRITTHKGETVFETNLAKKTDIPVVTKGNSYITTQVLPFEYLSIPPDEQEEVEAIKDQELRIQARLFQRNVDGTNYELLIARPLLLLDIEFREVILELTSGIAVTIVIIFFVAYIVTGRMLKPLNVMNHQIRQIRESSLENRIPLGKSRDELYQLGVELNSMFDRLQYSFEKQREFIGNASHEMKSPLTILMIGHEELLMGDLPEQARHELEKQLETMRRLNKLIRDLLSIARLEQEDKLEREIIPLDGLFNSILNDYEELIRMRGLRVIKMVPSITVNGDYEKLHRLFINLIDNAIKYNLEEDGYIRIEAEDVDKGACVQIINSGTNIPDEDLPQIFSQFYRVEKSRAKTFGGTGLGLTIAKRIVEMHGGTITAVNEEGAVKIIVNLIKIEQN